MRFDVKMTGQIKYGKNSRNETPNITRSDRKRDANKRRTSLLPHVKKKTRSTTCKILEFSETPSNFLQEVIKIKKIR